MTSISSLYKQQGATLMICMILITACILFTSVLVENTLLEFRGKTNYLQKIESLNATENTGAEIRRRFNQLTEPLSEHPYCSNLSCTNIFRIISKEELSNIEWWKQNGIKISPIDSNEEAYVFIQLLSSKVFSQSKTNFYYEVLIFDHNINNNSLTILKYVFLKTFDSKSQLAYPATRIAWLQLR
jgi:hypothetical protein